MHAWSFGLMMGSIDPRSERESECMQDDVIRSLKLMTDIFTRAGPYKISLLLP